MRGPLLIYAANTDPMSIQFRMAIARSFSGTLTVLLGLDFNADEGCGFLLGLDHANGLPVSEKEVVGLAKAVPQGEFSDGNAWAGVDVGIGPVLDKPSGGNEHAVDGLAGFSSGVKIVKKLLAISV